MKKSIALLFLLITHLSFSQTAEGAATDAPRMSDSRLFDAMSDLRNRKKRPGTPPQNIKGSYFFEARFQPAKVIYFGEKLKGSILLRYNAYNDELEIEKTPDQKDTEEILLKSVNVEATIAGENYRLLSYKPKEDAFPEMGYFIIVSDGSSYRLFLKRKKVFMDAVEARTGLERSFPARFVDQVNYYYQIGDGTLLPLKRNKSGLREVFRGKESALKNLLKTEKLKPNDSEDLLRIFEFFNE